MWQMGRIYITIYPAGRSPISMRSLVIKISKTDRPWDLITGQGHKTQPKADWYWYNT